MAGPTILLTGATGFIGGATPRAVAGTSTRLPGAAARRDSRRRVGSLTRVRQSLARLVGSEHAAAALRPRHRSRSAHPQSPRRAADRQATAPGCHGQPWEGTGIQFCLESQALMTGRGLAPASDSRPWANSLPSGAASRQKTPFMVLSGAGTSLLVCRSHALIPSLLPDNRRRPSADNARHEMPRS